MTSAGPSAGWRDGGVGGYAVILGGQAVSEIGTRMTTFALAWWVWQRTGAATPLTLMLFFATAPALLLSPFAGVIVDRFSRRTVLLASDFGAALGTVAILVLLAAGRLEIWHVYAAQAVSSCFQAFQMPAFQASATLMLPKRAYARAAGFTSLVHSSWSGPMWQALHVSGLRACSRLNSCRRWQSWHWPTEPSAAGLPTLWHASQANLVMAGPSRACKELRARNTSGSAPPSGIASYISMCSGDSTSCPA
jgi:MFS family permease